MLAEADLDGLGLTTARQRTLRALAAAAAGGGLTLDPGADPGELAARLAELPGIGPWTIGYILMRAAGDPDAFPAADLGLRRALTRLGAPTGHEARWRPWRAYAAMQLWTWPAQPGGARPAPTGSRPARTDPPQPAQTDVAWPARPAVLAPRAEEQQMPGLPARTPTRAGRPVPASPVPGNPVPGNPVPGNPVPAPEPAHPVLATVVDTPIGPLSLLTQGGQLIAGGFTADPGVMHARLSPPLRALPLGTARPADLPWLASPVAAYFGGDLRALDTIPVYQPGPASRQRLWAALRAVPPGRAVSYTELAAQAGNPRAPRAAGAACAYNLIAPVVPATGRCGRTAVWAGTTTAWTARPGCCTTRAPGRSNQADHGTGTAAGQSRDRATGPALRRGRTEPVPEPGYGTGPAPNPAPTQHRARDRPRAGLRCGEPDGWTTVRSGRRKQDHQAPGRSRWGPEGSGSLKLLGSREEKIRAQSACCESR